ncbi:prohibitin family protein, partial [Staphylococcus epidermidis]
MNITTKGIRKIAISAAVGLVVLVGGCGSFTVVPYGNVGVTKTFGKLGDTTLSEGLQWKIPFVESVIEVNVQVQKAAVTASAVSKDMQPITTKVSVNYSVDRAAANNLLQNVGTAYEEKIIAPNIQEVIKAVTARYSAEQLINKRDIVSSEIREAMVTRMKPYGLDVVAINTTDLHFSEA